MKNPNILLLCYLAIFFSCETTEDTPIVNTITGDYQEFIDESLNITESKLIITEDSVSQGYWEESGVWRDNYHGAYKMETDNTFIVDMVAGDRNTGCVTTTKGTYCEMHIIIEFEWIQKENKLDAFTTWAADGWSGLEFPSHFEKL
jgi:hypothetical protein